MRVRNEIGGWACKRKEREMKLASQRASVCGRVMGVCLLHFPNTRLTFFIKTYVYIHTHMHMYILTLFF